MRFGGVLVEEMGRNAGEADVEGKQTVRGVAAPGGTFET
jgi:hypothetical protein